MLQEILVRNKENFVPYQGGKPWREIPEERVGQSGVRVMWKAVLKA
jgi:hypothetical protein